jgi:hypothetical protein
LKDGFNPGHGIQQEQEEFMGIVIIVGTAILASFGLFLGRVLAAPPKQKELEDQDQMDWLSKYQETKCTKEDRREEWIG